MQQATEESHLFPLTNAPKKEDIIEWLGGDLKAHTEPNPCHGLGTPTSSGCPGSIQPGLGHLQGWGTHSSGQQCQGLTTLWVKNLFLTSNLDVLSCTFHKWLLKATQCLCSLSSKELCPPEVPSQLDSCTCTLGIGLTWLPHIHPCQRNNVFHEESYFFQAPLYSHPSPLCL